LEIKEILNSGILESYVLGVASPEEEKQVEEYRLLYPEIEMEINEISLSIDNYALKFEQEPPSDLREKVLKNMADLSKETVKPFITTTKNTEIKNSFWSQKFAIAASYILLIASIAANIYFYSKWQKTQGQLADLNSKNDELASTYKTTQKEYQNLVFDVNILQNPETKTVMLEGLKVAPKSWVKLYWNKNKKMVLLASQDLPEAPNGKQYQLWAIIDGKPVDAGMLELKSGMQKLKEIDNASAFAITLEKKGGELQPKGDMYVLGKVSV